MVSEKSITMSLSTEQLNAILMTNEVTKKYFLGSYPACIYPSTNNSVYSFITNTDNHNLQGTHWTAWFVRDGVLSFFDSFGRSFSHPDFPDYYKKIAKQFKEVEYSTVQIQSLDSWTCGYFCMNFIYSKSLGFEYKDFITDFSNILHVNDYIVLNFINSII